jgi:hypothetical protein
MKLLHHQKGARMSSASADVLIIGGGLGGVSAALAAARLGRRVILTEETRWLGGQLTTQAVPPDEHQWSESFGTTRTYRMLRDGARDYYRRFYPLTNAARSAPDLRLGASLVTRMSVEPRVWLAVIESMLAPYRAADRITVHYNLTAVAVESDGDRIRSVTLRDGESGESRTFTAPYVLDATETGELLPLGNIEYVIGAESKADTGEPHALDNTQPRTQQAITHVMALSHFEGEDHTISRPEDYDRYLSRFQWPKERHIFPEPDSGWFSLWKFRRVLYTGHFEPGFMGADITLWNAMNDYYEGPIIDVPQDEIAENLHGARQLSLSLLYWMQTEAPRLDGGAGYPGLKLRPDATETSDGLAMRPYIRESRRIKAELTVLEQHVSAEVREGYGAECWSDSVGTGRYSIDIHMSTPVERGGQPVRQSSRTDGHQRPRVWPFQIPLGALLPERVENLLPACKNLGVTHITNGCYRLHPVEWNIGESIGTLVVYCLEHDVSPRQVRHTPELLEAYQRLLERQGVEIEWPDLQAGGSYNQWVNNRPHWNWGETDGEALFPVAVKSPG